MKPTRKVSAQNASVSRQEPASDFGMATVGRKTLLLDKTKMCRLLHALEAGNTIMNACALTPISDTTFYRWLKEANEAVEGSPLCEFRGSVKRAMAIAEHRNLMVIQMAAETHWQAAAWFLERRYRNDWARTKFLPVGGQRPASPNSKRKTSEDQEDSRPGEP